VLLRLDTLRHIQAGEIDLAFRLWRKPTVKAGGRLRTAVGELAIQSVDVVDPATITDQDAQRAGCASADALRAELFTARPARGRTAKPDASSAVYRVEVRWVGGDDRAARRVTLLDPAELDTVAARVRAMDARSAKGPWAIRALELIAAWPGRRAPELAELAGWETAPWKTNVRRLKELGLTESLPVGYRLSPRGEQVLDHLRR
jgi:hypothetical protein